MRCMVTGAAMLIMGVAGCTAPAPDGTRLSRPLPYAAIFKPPRTGEVQIMLLAAYHGHLVIDANCVRIKLGQATYLPVFYHGTEVGRDSRGPFVKDPETGGIFRNGNSFAGGGGGPRDTLPDEATLATGAVPPSCRGPSVTLNPGFRRR